MHERLIIKEAPIINPQQLFLDASDANNEARALNNKTDRDSQRSKAFYESIRNTNLLALLHIRTQQPIPGFSVGLTTFPKEIYHPFSNNQISFFLTNTKGEKEEITTSISTILKQKESSERLLDLIGSPDYLYMESLSNYVNRKVQEVKKASISYNHSQRDGRFTDGENAVQTVILIVNNLLDLRKDPNIGAVRIGVRLTTEGNVALDQLSNKFESIFLPLDPRVTELAQKTPDNYSIGKIGLGNRLQ